MNREGLYQWSVEIARWFPVLKQWQVLGLALWSVGIVLSERCTMSKVAEHLLWMGKADSVERRLQRFVANGRIVMDEVMGLWIEWVLTVIQSVEVVILVDESKLGVHLGIMLVGVAYRGCCIPLAWCCYRLDAYPAEGQVVLIRRLLSRVKAHAPVGCRLLVEADRGIGTSPKLVAALNELELDYLLRVQGSTRFKTEQGKAYPLKHLVKPGESWHGSGWVFKKHGWLRAPVYVHWQLGYSDLWCLISNRDDLDAHDYAIRYWQEAGFRDLKSDGWNWQRSQVWLPDHADRLVLALALAYAWTLTHGTLIADAAEEVRRVITRGKQRIYSCFREGLRYLAHLRQHALPMCLHLEFVPQPLLAKSVVT